MRLPLHVVGGERGREVCYFPNECDQAIQDGDWGVPSSSYPLFIKTQMDTLTRVPPSTPPRLITRARIRSKRNNSPSSKERLGKGGEFFFSTVRFVGVEKETFKQNNNCLLKLTEKLVSFFGQSI